ncbi:hypothetical protein MPH_07961 [Macrophomina phaseolina MS6]|uniref:Uncharacterized protein n=1 Tax=Macrophomina phaseolina (strain MS6) TaxID=1126212 RepID=K2RJL1_MACPH|nr:hypothetical protein MPH_07961 [Macrophomina phaseolina MS6]
MRWVVMIRCIGYVPYSTALYCNSVWGTQWFLIFGAVTCGLSVSCRSTCRVRDSANVGKASALWPAEAAIGVGYPEVQRRGICTSHNRLPSRSQHLDGPRKARLDHRNSHPTRDQQRRRSGWRHCPQNLSRPRRPPVPRPPPRSPYLAPRQTHPQRRKTPLLLEPKQGLQDPSPRLLPHLQAQRSPPPHPRLHHRPMGRDVPRQLPRRVLHRARPRARGLLGRRHRRADGPADRLVAGHQAPTAHDAGALELALHTSAVHRHLGLEHRGAGAVGRGEPRD